MALNKEDKADVKGAFGTAIANKVAKVTRDRALPGSGRTQEIANRIKARADKSSGQGHNDHSGVSSMSRHYLNKR